MHLLHDFQCNKKTKVYVYNDKECMSVTACPHHYIIIRDGNATTTAKLNQINY